MFTDVWFFNLPEPLNDILKETASDTTFDWEGSDANPLTGPTIIHPNKDPNVAGKE